ncbi:MAG: hypothetical protein JWN70_5400 [Planctomycetaceae bacterium]|nr:hypothetical protein [Planctomycetaceae bacterium]
MIWKTQLPSKDSQFATCGGQPERISRSQKSFLPNNVPSQLTHRLRSPSARWGKVQVDDLLQSHSRFHIPSSSWIVIDQATLIRSGHSVHRPLITPVN